MQLKKLLLTLIVLIPILTFGQSKQENSPYSRFGIGNVVTNNYGLGQHIGGIGYGLRDSLSVNPYNPAAVTKMIRRNKTYSIIAFETGLDINNQFVTNGLETVNSGNVTFSHLLLGFPVTEKFGITAGFLPYSNTAYEVFSTFIDPIDGETEINYEGTGDIFKTFIGAGYEFGNLSVGVNANYMFGGIDQTRAIIYPSTLHTVSTRAYDQFNVSDFVFDVGAQLALPLKNKSEFVLGTTYTTGGDLKTEKTQFYESFVTYGGNESRLDTTLITNNEKGQLTIPSNLGFGFTYRNNKQWLVGADVKFANWSEFSLFGTNDNLQNITQVNAGMQFTSQTDRSYSYLQRVTYRLGGHYSTGSLQINDTNIPEYGITFGVGLPYGYKLFDSLKDEQRKREFIQQKLNLSFAYGSRGSLDSGLFRETYFNISLGININDAWFIKKKFD